MKINNTFLFTSLTFSYTPSVIEHFTSSTFLFQQLYQYPSKKDKVYLLYEKAHKAYLEQIEFYSQDNIASRLY